MVCVTTYSSFLPPGLLLLHPTGICRMTYDGWAAQLKWRLLHFSGGCLK